MNFYMHAYKREMRAKPSEDAVNNNLTNGHAKFNGHMNGEANGKIVANGNGTIHMNGVTKTSIESNGHINNGFANGHIHTDSTEDKKVQ